MYINYQTERWKSEGAIGGLPRWKELSPVYLARKKADKKAMKQGNYILTYTGRLGGSVTLQNSDAREVVTDKFISVGTVVPYADYVDHYKSDPTRKKRPFTTFDEQFKKKVNKAISDYFGGKE